MNRIRKLSLLEPDTFTVDRGIKLFLQVETAMSSEARSSPQNVAVVLLRRSVQTVVP